MAKNPRLIDIAGRKFGRWFVQRQAGNAPRGGALWLCRCDCGVERSVLGSDLRQGKSVSCGCHRAEVTGAMHRTHGKSGTRLYEAWKNMRARCSDTENADYGARRISVCDEWQTFTAFEAWALSVGYRDDLTIERMDVNGDYEPSNCMWVEAGLQARNRRFVKRAPDGELWWHKAQRNGITRSAYEWRKGKGWPMPLVVTWPLGKRRSAPGQRDPATGRFQ